MRDTELKWIRIIASTTAILGILGLLVLHSPHASAAPGIEGGTKPIGANPFSNPGAKPKPFFDDEDDFDDEDSDTGMANTAGAAGNANNNADSGDSGSRGGGNYSAGGKAGIINKSSNTPKPLDIDSDSGEGSKEMVTEFNFPNADIMDIAKTLGRLTGKNFILDSKDVKGQISIVANSPISVGDAWRAFLTALDMSGFALIPSGKFIRIARQRDARDKQLRTFTGDYSPNTDSLITRVFQLKYLSAEEVARNFRSFMPANSRIVPYEQTNTVIVTDTGANIGKLSKLLEILDIEGYDAGIEVVPVKFASAAEIAKLVDSLLPGNPAGAPGGAPRFGGSSGGGRFSARRTKEGGIINNIIADERTNNLIVHANGKGVEQIKELLAKLDRKVSTSQGGGKVHVVYLQFADSEQMASTLNNVSQGSGARPGGAPGAGMGTGVNPTSGSLFEGAIKVASDKSTNSLVITASPTDFTVVQRVINRLDIPRDQVYAEIVIMEVGLGRDFAFSTNIISPMNGIGFAPNTDLFDFIANPIALKGATLGFKAGTTTTVNIAGKDVPVSGVQGLIHAIQSRSNANVLATPQILALDNTEATFESGEKIPVPQTTIGQGGTTTQGITFTDISLKITIKPKINKLANFVALEIKTQMEDIEERTLPAQVQGLANATLRRSANTNIVVADQDTVVLGGLIRDKQTETISKIPILGDIPLLGWLFKSKSSNVAKSNLLIFITPSIIRQYEAAGVRTILDRKLKERDDFIENAAGGEDPMRGYRDNIIRTLPDVKDLMNKKPKNVVSLTDEGDEVKESDGSNSQYHQPSAPRSEPAIAVPPPAVPSTPDGSLSAPPPTSPINNGNGG